MDQLWSNNSGLTIQSHSVKLLKPIIVSDFHIFRYYMICGGNPPVLVFTQQRGGLHEVLRWAIFKRLISLTYCFYRALVNACSAVGAKICINLGNIINGNGFNRTCISACPASCTGIFVNLCGHPHHLLLMCSTFLNEYKENVNKEIPDLSIDFF